MEGAAKSPTSSSPQVVFVLGAPGAGKGTQCLLIEERLGFKHISAGDCLREERNDPTSQLGDMINTYIKEGKIVPVQITCRLLRKKMEKFGWENGKFLIDGFPRNEDNLLGWEREMKDVHTLMCLVLECPPDVVLQRILQRGLHSGRVDDNVESVKKRFETFNNETIPIIQHFEKLNKCRRVNGCQEIEAVWTEIAKVFEEKAKTSDVVV